MTPWKAPIGRRPARPWPALDQVGPRLKQVRARRGATLTGVARATGISKSTLSRLENGQRRPTLELLLALSQAYRVPLDDLVGAPEVGDPRLRLKPGRVKGRTVIPLTRQPDGVQAWKIVIPAGKVTAEPRAHDGHEWIYVLWFGSAGEEPAEILEHLHAPRRADDHPHRSRTSLRQARRTAAHDKDGTSSVPTMFVMVGLPAAGKTSRAREIASARNALRLTPDEWMIPLFGQEQPEGKRIVVEGRLIWLALAALRIGVDVVLDFGVWARVERSALRALAASVGATSELVYLQVDEAEQWRRVQARGADRDRDHVRDDQGRPRRLAAGLPAAGRDRTGGDGHRPAAGGVRLVGGLGGGVLADGTTRRRLRTTRGRLTCRGRLRSARGLPSKRGGCPGAALTAR